MMRGHFYREVLDSLSEGVYCVDLERVITYWNKGAERITGYTAEEVIGKTCADNILRHIDSLGTEICVHGCPLAASMTDSKPHEASVYLHHKNGHRVPVLVKASPLRHGSGNVYGAVESFSVITSPMSLLEELEKFRKEALRDPLTGVGNRRYAESTLQRLHNMFVKDGLPYGVIFVDIDHFKNVNDTWGHGVGDMVLTMVANTIAAGLRALDVVCRWGGEEFLIMLPSVDCDDLQRISERIRILIKNSWITHRGDFIRVNASFGGTVVRKGELPESVVARSDSELYYCKESGRDCISIRD